jgi:glycerol-3-phosphate acyltransferase PlsY
MNCLLITIFFSYLVGSIPFGYVLVRIFRGQDVRESGSGNIGATNVARSSPALGMLTLLLDAGNSKLEASTAVLTAIAAFIAVLGHMFPLWLKFKGGKGVATGLGSFALIAPKATLVAVGIFAITLLAFRFVSFSSIFTVAIFPLPVLLLHEYHERPAVLALISACSIMIVLKHQANIRRLIQGTEPRFQLRRG